jgi:hypothetical protein
MLKLRDETAAMLDRITLADAIAVEAPFEMLDETMHV